MNRPPSQGSKMLHGPLRQPNEQGKPSVKTDRVRFDAFVGRYYPVVYRFASRLTDDPREAVLLTHAALNSVRKQVWLPRDEITLARILLKAVVRCGLTDSLS